MNQLMNRFLGTAGLALLAFSVTHSTADAQVRRPWYRPGAAYVGVGLGGYSPVSAVGDARRGMADVIRSGGQAAVDYTGAMINYEEAKSRYIDNELKWTETYIERQKIGRAYRRELYDEKYASIRHHLANKESGAPPRLGPGQLDPSSGNLEWPDALMADEYLTMRRELEELFALRASTSGSHRYSRDIKEKADEFKATLQADIQDIPAYQYIAAKNFLESLAYEGRFPPSS